MEKKPTISITAANHFINRNKYKIEITFCFAIRIDYIKTMVKHKGDPLGERNNGNESEYLTPLGSNSW